MRHGRHVLWALIGIALLVSLPRAGYGGEYRGECGIECQVEWVESVSFSVGPPAQAWATGPSPAPPQWMWSRLAHQLVCWELWSEDVLKGQFPLALPVTIHLQIWEKSGENRYYPVTFYTETVTSCEGVELPPPPPRLKL